MILLACGIAATALILILYAHWFKHTNSLKGIGGPTLYPVFGNALLLRNPDEFLNVVNKTLTDYNGTVRLCIGPQVSVYTTDYKFLEYFLSSNELINKFWPYNFLKNWLGEGLITSTSQKWKKHRKMITPSFHFKILEQFVDVFERNGDVLIEKLLQHVGKSATDICPLATLLTLDVICETAMGTQVNAQLGGESEYVHNVEKMCKLLVERSSSLLYSNDFIYQFSSKYEEEKKSLKVIHDYALNVIKERREHLINSTEDIIDDGTNIKKKTAFLDLLLKSTIDGQPLSDTDIQEEVDTFMFGGHLTTANAISFTAYCLAEYPEIQRKVLEEQKRIFGNSLKRHATHQDLQEMNYLEMVIKETLRLYPPAPIIARYMTSDCKFNDDITFKKGIHVVFNIFSTHRNPKYFHSPEKFDPERFSEKNVRKDLVYSFIPFSAGPRSCIGQKFAVAEMKSVISKIVRNYKLTPAVPRHELHLSFELALRSSNGVLVKINKRIAD